MLVFTETGFLEDPLQKCLEIAARDPLRPYLFVGSSDSEADDFAALAAELRFTRPEEGAICNGIKCTSKRAHMAHLLPGGKNIAITSCAFNYIDDAMLKEIWYGGYTLLSVGDAIFWSDRIAKYSAANIEEAIRRRQLIPVAQGTYLLSSAHRAEYVLGMLDIPLFTYNDRLLTRLTAGGRSEMFWSPPPFAVNAFRSAHIVHAMPAASSLASYLRIFGIQSKTEEGGRQHNRDLASLLRVVPDGKFNERGEDAGAYTTRWYLKEKSAAEDVFKDMRNVLLQAEAGSERSSHVAYAMPNEILKDLKESIGRPVFRGRGFPAISAADCGAYSTARVLCYCANTHFPVASAAYFHSNGVSFDGDAWSTYHMLRWISRSAVRNHEPVSVYVPSKRMRGLLENWIQAQGE